MLRIRLQRVGRKNDPSFRIVVTESTNATKSGKFLEIVGSYYSKLGTIQLDADRIKHWLSVGAQATGTVHNILVKEGVVTGPKIAVAASARRKKDGAEGEVTGETTPAAEAAAQPTAEAATEASKAEEAATAEPAPEEAAPAAPAAEEVAA